MRRRLYQTLLVLGILMIPGGVALTVWSTIQTGHYAQITIHNDAAGGYDHVRGAYVSISAKPWIGIGVVVAGSIILSIAIFALAFGSFFGDDGPDPAVQLAHVTRTTTLGTGGPGARAGATTGTGSSEFRSSGPAPPPGAGPAAPPPGSGPQPPPPGG